MQIFISAGNSGAGANTVGDPSVATNSVSVGAYITRRDLAVELRLRPANDKGLHPFSSRGPREDGGFKPDIVAPGAAISTTPLWQPGGPVTGTYTLPPGYSMFNGTSMAAPQATGAGGVAGQRVQGDHAALGRPRRRCAARSGRSADVPAPARRVRAGRRAVRGDCGLGAAPCRAAAERDHCDRAGQHGAQRPAGHPERRRRHPRSRGRHARGEVQPHVHRDPDQRAEERGATRGAVAGQRRHVQLADEGQSAVERAGRLRRTGRIRPVPARTPPSCSSTTRPRRAST